MTLPIDDDVVEINNIIFANRLDLTAVLDRGKVSRVTWYRWRKGLTEPKKSTLARLRAAADALAAEPHEPAKSRLNRRYFHARAAVEAK